MRRIERFALTALLVLLTLVSCHKDGLEVNELKTQAYVYQNGDMGLSLFFQADCKDPMSIGMVVTSPSSLVWTLNAYEAVFENVSYYGSSDIAMPSGIALEKGLWNVTISYKDGSSVSRAFELSYGNVEKALSSYQSNAMTKAWFDADSNLTILGR